VAPPPSLPPASRGGGVRLLLLALLLSGCAAPTMAEKIDAIVKDRDVAVAYRDLATGATYLHREHEVFHAASTIKLPIMIGLYARDDVDLDEAVPVTNLFRSMADGSEFKLDPAEDEDPWTYQQLGKTVPLRKLVERMIVRSSNLATNLLVARADPAATTSLCRSLGARETRVLRGVQDQKAFDKGMNNVTSASDLMTLLAALATRRLRNSAEMEDILSHQELNEGIPAGLPEKTRVAHKTGAITRIYHDAALVRPEGEKGYVLVVLTRGVEDEKAAAALVREISRTVWEGRPSRSR